MNPSEVLGLAINDFFRGHKTATITVHSPDFDPDEQDVSYYFRNFIEMPDIEKEAIKLAHGKILDIGAAAGSHSLELQKRGYSVTALELSELSCAVMKKRGVEHIVNSDIFQYKRKKFNTLMLLMNGIGLVQTIDGLIKFLKHSKTLLNSGGQIIFDSANLIYLMDMEDPFEHRFNLNSRYYGEIEFVLEYNDIKSDSFSWLYIDFDSICYYAEKEGYIPELIMKDNNFQYLCRLTLNS